jgi:hypothetical protein
MLLADIANDSVTVVTRSGITLGAAIAIVCSWQRLQSRGLVHFSAILV